MNMFEMIGSLIGGIAAWVWWFFSAFQVIFWSGALPGFWFDLLLLLIFAIWFGSAFLSATLAELCKKPVGEAFFMGLLAPWIYPYQKARIWEIPPSEEEIAQEEEAARAAEFEDEEEEEDEEIDGYCRSWFAQIEVDDEGERVGPFQLTLLDGTVLQLDSIRDLRDDLMVVVNSATGKTLRIKYDNVADFESVG